MIANIGCTAANFVLLHWLVVDGGVIGILLTLLRRTYPTSSDIPPMKATRGRYHALL